MERCQRCGKEDQDLRTLWMACFYAMEELGLPFEEQKLFDVDEKHLKRTKKKRVATIQTCLSGGGQGPKERIPYEEEIVTARGRVHPRNVYTLRVCKSCRGDWMSAIKDWFESVPESEGSCGSGIFVRKNGATVEITQEEWDREHPGQEPVRYKRES